MADHDGNCSNPYHPDPAKCCEACIFGRGKHADWCDQAPSECRDCGYKTANAEQMFSHCCQ